MNGEGGQRRPAALDGGLGVERRRDFPDVHRFSHEAMATIFEIYALHPDREYAAQASRAAFDLIDRLEQELSRFVENSDISRINRLGPGERTRVAPTTVECLVIARYLFDLTAGAFDIAIGTGLPGLALDPEDSYVRAAAAGVRLDLGGIGKGYAVDLVAELLEEWGIRQALVHGGFSSVLALDPPASHGDGWPLTLSDPGTPSRVLARLAVRQASLSASGRRKGDHIIDPRSREAVRGRAAAWVVLPRPRQHPADAATPQMPRLAAAAVADALTTAFMLLSEEEIEALCGASPGLEAWILPDASDAETPYLVHFPRD